MMAEVLLPDAGTLTFNNDTIRNNIMNNLAFTQAESSHVFINAVTFTDWAYTGTLTQNKMYKTDASLYNASLLGVDYATIPENPQEGYLYWKSTEWNGVPTWAANRVVQYKNGAWNSNITAWFEEQDDSGYADTHSLTPDAYSDVGISNIDVLTASESTGKKYYFELVKTDNTIIEV